MTQAIAGENPWRSALLRARLAPASPTQSRFGTGSAGQHPPGRVDDALKSSRRAPGTDAIRPDRFLQRLGRDNVVPTPTFAHPDRFRSGSIAFRHRLGRVDVDPKSSRRAMELLRSAPIEFCSAWAGTTLSRHPPSRTRIDFDPARSRFDADWVGSTSTQNPVVAHLELMRSGPIVFCSAWAGTTLSRLPPIVFWNQGRSIRFRPPM